MGNAEKQGRSHTNEAIQIIMSIKDEDIDISDMPEFAGVDPSLWKRRDKRLAERKKQAV